MNAAERTVAEQLFAEYGRRGWWIAWTDVLRTGTDPKVIKNWQRHPEHLAEEQFAIGISKRCAERNLGLCLRKSNKVVIDLDGPGALARLIAITGPLPETAVVLTPGHGGESAHLYFEAPGGCRHNKIEVTGEGKVTVVSDGYVMLPPSRRTDLPGEPRYEWDPERSVGNVEIAELPVEAYEKLVGAAGATKRTANAEAGEPISEPGRNNFLMSEAGKMRRIGSPESAILAALRALNTARCSPPLNDDEVVKVAASAATYKPEPGAGRDDRHATPDDLHAAPDAPYGRCEVLLCNTFLHEHGEAFKYAHGIGWFRWTGVSWAQCREEEQVQAMAETARAVERQAIAAKDKPTAWACHQMARLKSALGLAQSNPAVSLLADRLDVDAYLLGTPGGVVDLRTGRVRPATRTDLITMLTTTRVGDTVGPRWRAFLERILPDPAMRRYVKSLIGSALIGRQSEHILPIFKGIGANGKSVLVDAIIRIVGDYGLVSPLSLLIQSSHQTGPTPEVARLRGRRIVAISETPEDGKLSVERVKSITGGDRVSARLLYSQPFEFDPTWTIILVTNHSPRVPDSGHAIWRRIRLIEFNQVIPPDEQIPDLAESLIADEGAGILRWMVDGAVEYVANGLQEPSAVTAANAAYRASEDWFSAWLEEETIRGGSCRAGDLIKNYREWAETHGAPKLSDAAMRERLEAHDVTRESFHNAVTWVGLTLRARTQ